MVLHLLGKKSWNVYNTANVDRVRRDEADAKAQEEADEQRMQEEDAERRIAALRGEEVLPLPNEEVPSTEKEGWRKSRTDDTYAQRDLKRRRMRGEDDTERDMRYARQDAEAGHRATQALVRGREKDAPLQDHAGNIQLIPAPNEVSIRKAEKNAEAEAEKAKKRKRDEDQVTMRFSNAAGYQNGMQKPWYAASKAAQPTPNADLALAEVQGKDVWGNEDPRRKEREQNRVSSNDPFAAMQRAQRQLKQSERDKKAWQKNQQAELEQLKQEQRKDGERRHRDREQDSLDGFSLDASAEKSSRRERSAHDQHRKHRHHHRRHRSRSRSRERERHRSHRQRSHRQRDRDER